MPGDILSIELLVVLKLTVFIYYASRGEIVRTNGDSNLDVPAEF